MIRQVSKRLHWVKGLGTPEQHDAANTTAHLLMTSPHGRRRFGLTVSKRCQQLAASRVTSFSRARATQTDRTWRGHQLQVAAEVNAAFESRAAEGAARRISLFDCLDILLLRKGFKAVHPRLRLKGNVMKDDPSRRSLTEKYFIASPQSH